MNPISQKFNITSLLKFVFPTSVMMVFAALYSIVDGIFIARFVGPDALASINIVFPIISVTMGIGIMFAAGGSAIIARKMGEQKPQEARENFTFIVLAAIVISITISSLGFVFMEPLARFLGASDILMPYCLEYLKIIMIFISALVIQVMFEFFFVTAGRPWLGLGVTFAAGVANAFFDYIFIVRLKMGVSGAAWATVIGYFIPVIAGIIFFFHKDKILHFVKPKTDLKVLLESCINGSSEMVINLSSSVTTFLFNITMMKLIGESGVAAITTVLYTQFLFISMLLGFSNGVAPVISYNFGSRNTKMLKRIFHICINFIAASSLVMFIFSLVFAKPIANVFFIKGSDVYNLTVNGFMLFSVTYLFAGFNIFASALFTALSNGKISALISFARTFVFIAAGILILPRFLGIDGVWLSIPSAEILALVLSLGFIIAKRKKYGYSF